MNVNEMPIPPPQTPRIWTPKQILWATAIGGYFSGFYFLSKNYQALGYPKLAKKSIFTGFVTTFILITTLLLLPEDAVEHFVVFLLFLQGYLGVGYLMGEHYKTVYDWDLSKKLWIALPAGALVLLAIPFYLSESILDYIPSFTIALIPALTLNGFAQSYQEPHLKELMEKGGQKNSTGRLLGTALLALLFQILLILAFAVLSFMLFPE